MRAFVKAVDQILENPNNAVNRWPRDPTDIGPLPTPSIPQDSELYPLALLDDEPPGCLTLEQSTFGKPQVVIADKAEDFLNPYREAVKKIDSGNDAWSIVSRGPNWQMVPREERSMGEICKPPDHCAFFQQPSSGVGTPIVFRLPKMTLGMIMICGGNIDAGKSTLVKPGTLVALFDGKELDPSGFKVFPTNKCVALQSKFNGPVEDKHGHLYLSIVAKSNFEISQVITA